MRESFRKNQSRRDHQRSSAGSALLTGSWPLFRALLALICLVSGPSFSAVASGLRCGTLFDSVSLGSEMTSRDGSSQRAVQLPERLFNEDSKTALFTGLTPHGLAVLKDARDKLRARHRIFESRYRGLSGVYHGLNLARLASANMFLTGGPGAAKSGVVKFMTDSEQKRAYKIQMHQTMTEQALIGGERWDAAREGRFEVNTEGTMVDSEVAHVDEMDKGNPSVYNTILSLLNRGERFVLLGRRQVESSLETVFSTSNASISELYQQFVENSLRSTVPALLNRYHIKAFLYNWLSPLDQSIMDDIGERQRQIRIAAKYNPEFRNSEVLVEPPAVNWKPLRDIAQKVMVVSPEMQVFAREFINDIRLETIKAKRAYEESHLNNPRKYPVPYMPTADWTERLRQENYDFIIMSAFYDFLMSPLADDANIESLTRKPIMLGPDSVWRYWYSTTTILPGEHRLAWKRVNGGGNGADDHAADPQLTIETTWRLPNSEAADRFEELMLTYYYEEQDRFRSIFEKRIAALRKLIRDEASFPTASDGSEETSLEDTFEVRLISLRPGT